MTGGTAATTAAGSAALRTSLRDLGRLSPFPPDEHAESYRDHDRDQHPPRMLLHEATDNVDHLRPELDGEDRENEEPHKASGKHGRQESV